MTREEVIKIVMLQATVLSLIEHDESTTATNKIRRQMRKGLNHIYKHERSLYDRMAAESNNVWNIAKEEINDEDFAITVSDMLLSLWLLVEDEKYLKKFYSNTTMDYVLNSLRSNSQITEQEYADTEKNATKLVGIFAKELGVSKDNKLKRLFTIMKQNHIIDNG